MTGLPTPDPRLRAFVEQTGLARSGDAATWTPLTGGVSSDIWRVDLPGRSICIKCALPQLKVAQAVARAGRAQRVRMGVDQLRREALSGQRADAARERRRARHFRDELSRTCRATRCGSACCSTASRMLPSRRAVGVDHRAAACGKRRRRRDCERLRAPMRSFTRSASSRTCSRRPRGIPRSPRALRSLAERTATTRIALVHGDVSPKNILLGPRGPGHPRRGMRVVRRPGVRRGVLPQPFPAEMRRQAGGRETATCAATPRSPTRIWPASTWEPRAAIEARIASLLPALTLARIDGKSPVEYLTDERDRQRVRRAAAALIADNPQRLADVSSQWRRAFTRQRSRE